MNLDENLEISNRIFKKNTMEKDERQRIWFVILILAILGVGFIFMISFQVSPKEKKDSKYRMDKISLTNEDLIHIKSSEEKEKQKEKWKAFSIALGTGLLIAGASFSSGALSGFLFGIPRIINSSALKSDELTQNVVLHNDNLVQISDWLTKIIVGVGLTQINALPEKLYELGKVISPCFNTSTCENTELNLQITISISILLYFLILGFIASYLWTRIYFGKILKQETTIASNKVLNK
jgi:hypothetical protein